MPAAMIITTSTTTDYGGPPRAFEQYRKSTLIQTSVSPHRYVLGVTCILQTITSVAIAITTYLFYWCRNGAILYIIVHPH